MSFLNPRKVEKNYDLFSTCAWYTPDVGGMFAVLGWFLVGMIVGSLVVMPLMFDGSIPMYYIMLVMYPLQFIPVFIFVRIKSSRNMTFERGYALDSSHFGRWGGWGLAVACVAAVLATGMLLEVVNHYLPDTEGTIIEMMERLLEGPLWVNLVTMCIMAPLLEEWLCRGVVLRGLLNYRHQSTYADEERPRGMNPALAILISAIFFAAIHGNVWQGVTAFAIGCLFGYVYYKTGSLRLTILMHCANNTASVLLAKFGSEASKEAKSLFDVFPLWEYAIIFAVSLIVLLYILNYLRSLELQDSQGNCDVIPSAEDEALQGS